MARPLTVTAYGNAQVDTTVKKTGSGSIQLDGNGDYLQISQTDGELNVEDNQPWTVECWAYWVGGGNYDYAVMSSRASGTTNSWVLGVEQRDTIKDRISFGNGFGSLLYEEFISSDEWHHIAVTCDGTNVYLWFDGIQRAGPLTGNTSLKSNTSTTNNPLRIGKDIVTAGFGDFNGWIDEVKISNVCRYTGNFTPASALGIDSNTLLKINGDGADASTTFTDNVGVNGTANLTASFNIDKADGRTFLRAAANLEALATELAVQNPSPSMVYLQNDVFTWADTDTWDTIYDGDDKWAVWERQTSAAFSLSAKPSIEHRGSADLNSTSTLDVSARLSDVRASADLSTSASLEITGRILKLANLDITSLGELTVTAGVEVNAKADLISTADFYAKAGFLIGIDDPYDYTWDTVPEDQWNGFLIDQWRPSGWFAFDAVTLTASAGRTIDASATLEAFAAQMAVARTSDVRASAELNAVFTLESGSDNTKSAASVLFAEATLVSQSSVDHPGSADLQSAFTVDTNSRILKLANLDISSLGDLTVSASMTLNAGTNLNSQFTLESQALNLKTASSNLDAQFTETVYATLIPSVILDPMSASASLSVGAVMTYNGVATLEAFATELTAGQRLPGGRANLEAEFTTVVSATAVFGGSAQLEAFATELVAGRLSTVRGSAELSGTFVTEFNGELKLLDSQFIYKVLSDTRTFAVEDEQRKYNVLSENRIFDIDPESRGYQVLPENRTIDVGYLMQ